MGIFDRVKNYKMRRPSTIISYEERFQRLAKIINIVIEDIHNPLLDQINSKSAKNINSKLNNLKEEFNYCRESENVNHQDLNDLAKNMKSYIFYVLKIYQNDYSNVSEKTDAEFVIKVDSYILGSFSYDADRWMIKVNDEDLWYLGR